MRTRTVGRPLALIGTATLLAAPLLINTPVDAARSAPPEARAATAPNVMWPVAGGGTKDLRPARTKSTDIKAPCKRPVRAIHPGIARIIPTSAGGPYSVRVTTGQRGLVSRYGYMSSATITDGQLVQAGQPIGTVGKLGKATRCSLRVSITVRGKQRKASQWLNRHVGKQVPVKRLFGNTGFVVASFNVLGASHTTNGRRMPTYEWRTPRQVDLLAQRDVDVVGFQEFQRKQRDLFLASTGDTYGIFPFDRELDTDNSIAWRNSTMEFVSAETISVPYFVNDRQMPVVLLRHRATGREAYFINVHNPASVAQWGNKAAARRKAIAIERAKVIELRATGRAVFLLGDFNDRGPAFCPLTAGKLMISPDSIPSTACSMPKAANVDWVFAAGPARFTRYSRDWASKDMRLSDHPIVWARAHLAGYQ